MASHIAVVAIILSVVALGYRAPVEATSTTSNRSVLDQQSVSVDQIAAANVATSVAQTVDMSIETNVYSLAASLNTKTELAQTDASLLSKPQIVNQTGRKDITTYTSQAGDSVQSVAAKYGVSEDTIRWANSLSSDSLPAGKQLKILGVTGILYTVKSGDTAASLAEKYRADKDRIVIFNDLELTGFNAGRQIVIPDGILPESERPGYVAPRSLRSTGGTSSVSTTSLGGTVYAGNGYAFGYCTYYAYNRRAELGRPIGSNWGNAVSWASYARGAGFKVNNTPAAGAVFQNGGGWGGYGHVGIVEQVNSDGSITVSEMNYAGWNRISTRTIPASQVGSYSYIH